MLLTNNLKRKKELFLRLLTKIIVLFDLSPGKFTISKGDPKNILG